jgi:hypothetical protein
MQAIEEGNADKAEALQKKLEDIQAKNAKIAADLLAIGDTKDPFSTWAGSLALAILELNKLGKGIADVPGLIPGVNFNPSQNADRNYDMKVAAVTAVIDEITGGGDIGTAGAAGAAILAEDDTIPSILTKVADAVEVLTDTVVNVTPAVTPTGSSSMFNPYGPSVGGPGFGTQFPSITINIEGNVLDGDDFTDKVNTALLNANRQGLPRTAAGFLVDAG